MPPTCVVVLSRPHVYDSDRYELVVVDVLQTVLSNSVSSSSCCSLSMTSFLTSLTSLLNRCVYILLLGSRSYVPLGGKSAARRERNGFMVVVGWVGQEPGEYEVVGHLPQY